MASTTYLSPRSSSVMVDRAWAQSLGLNQVSGARRVGNFYRLPRVAYLRALQTMRDQFRNSEPLEAPAAFVTPAQQAPAVTVVVEPSALEPVATAAVEPLTPEVAPEPATAVVGRSLSPCMGAAGIESARIRRTNRVVVPA